MRFKEWISKELDLLAEQEWFSFPNAVTIGVMMSDNTFGPFHTEFFTLDGIDMRFEDWKLENGRKLPPPLHFSAPITIEGGQNAFINYNNAYVRQKATISPQAAFVTIRPDWARFAIFYHGNTVVKSSPFEEDREGIRNNYQFKSSVPTPQGSQSLAS